MRSTRELGRAALKRSLSDLAPGGVYRAVPVTEDAGGLLHHRFTLTARRPEGRGRRSAFCGTVPRVTPGGCYPPPCPSEPGLSSARTRECTTRSPAQLVHAHSMSAHRLEQNSRSRTDALTSRTASSVPQRQSARRRPALGRRVRPAAPCRAAARRRLDDNTAELLADARPGGQLRRRPCRHARTSPLADRPSPWSRAAAGARRVPRPAPARRRTAQGRPRRCTGRRVVRSGAVTCAYGAAEGGMAMLLGQRTVEGDVARAAQQRRCSRDQRGVRRVGRDRAPRTNSGYDDVVRPLHAQRARRPSQPRHVAVVGRWQGAHDPDAGVEHQLGGGHAGQQRDLGVPLLDRDERRG